MLANTAAILLGYALGFALAPAVELIGRALMLDLAGDWAMIMTMVIAIGMLLPIMQWLLLRRHLSQAGWWVLATIGGWFLGVAAIFLAVPALVGEGAEPGLVRYTVEYGSIGLALGVTQWLILRRAVARAGWWVMASLAGWVAVAFAIGRAITEYWEIVKVGAIPAAITGIALVWLLQQPRSDISTSRRKAA